MSSQNQLANPQTSQRYMPRFEVWMNVFIHYAIANVVNSLATLEFESSQRSIQGGSRAEGQAYVAWDKLVGNVLILEAHMMDLWIEQGENGKLDEKFDKARVAFHQAIHTEELGILGALEVASKFYHEIIELMRRRGLLRFKPPRSMAAPVHDE